MGKISGPCKAAAKKKFEVWPSAYASNFFFAAALQGPLIFPITNLFFFYIFSAYFP